MKLIVAKPHGGSIFLAENDAKLGDIYGCELLGTIEVEEPGKKSDSKPIGIAKRDIAEGESFTVEIDFGERTVSSDAIDFTQAGSELFINSLSPAPAKTVKKEARQMGDKEQYDSGARAVVFYAEKGAKNIKCTFDIEEKQ